MTKLPRYFTVWLPVARRPWRILDTEEKKYVRDVEGKALTFNDLERILARIEKLEKTS